MITTYEVRTELVQEMRALLTDEDQRKLREWWAKHLNDAIRETLGA
jgi:hypothetical protein